MEILDHKRTCNVSFYFIALTAKFNLYPNEKNINKTYDNRMNYPTRFFLN